MRLPGDLVIHLFQLGWTENDLRRNALLRIHQEQPRRPQPPLAGPKLANVHYIAGPQRDAIEHRGDICARIVAGNLHVDSTHAPAVPLLNVVDQVQRARLFQEAGIGFHVGEYVADRAVLVLDRGHVAGHLRLVEILIALQLQALAEISSGELRVSDKRNVADHVAGTFINHEGQRQPVLLLVEHGQATDSGAEETQAAVVGSQAIDVLVDLLLMDLALEEPQEAGLGLDLGSQPGVGGDGVAFECRP